MTDLVVIRVPRADMNTPVGQNLHQAVDEIVVSVCACSERLLEQFGLMLDTIIRRLRKQDDQTWVQVKSSVLLEKVPAVQGHDDIVVVDGIPHQIPVLPARLSQMRHIVGVVASHLCCGDEFATQAFVNQEALHQGWEAATAADFQLAP